MDKNENNIGMLFDLDGVLIDSESEYTKIWGEIARRYPTPYPDLPYRIKGMTLDNILSTYFPEEELQREVTDLLYDLESRMNYHWLPGAREFIVRLAQRNIPRVLVTSSDDKKMKHLQEEIPELMPMMTDIVTANRISRSKPDPEGYLLAASLIDADPKRCAVFEDSLQGVKAGHASGAFVVGIAGTLPKETISPYCNMVVENLSEIDLDSLIDKLNN